MKKIYLDYAASTPTDKRVKEAMTPFLEAEFGNPGSLHSFGQSAKAAIDKAREIISNDINAEFNEIIFTSSATEANNLIIRGTVDHFLAQNPNALKPHVIISAIEHDSVLETCRSLENKVDISVIPVSAEGLIDAKVLKEAIKENTILVSIIWASNVIGTIQPIKEIGEAIKEIRSSDPYPLFHSDCAQAFQFEKIDIKTAGLDSLTISGQKIYGPKGVGALYLKESAKKLVASTITGGSQEMGFRAGTENTPAIAGFGKAVEILGQERAEASVHIKSMRDSLWSQMQATIPGVELNGSLEHRLPNNLHVYFPDSDAETLLVSLDQKGFAVSIGSACKAGAHTPPYAVNAMNLGPKRAEKSLRISLGKSTKDSELKGFTEALRAIIRP